MSKSVMDGVKKLARRYGVNSFGALCGEIGVPETTLRRYLTGQFPMLDPLDFVARCRRTMGLTDEDTALLCLTIAPIVDRYTVHLPTDMSTRERAKVLVHSSLRQGADDDR